MLLLSKNIEHHIERHYDIESNKNDYLQEIPMDETFFMEKLKHCLAIEDSHLFYEEIYDNYSIHDTLETFEYLNYSSFYSFFNENLIDVPKCFKRTKSVKRKINDLDLLRFNNYIMRNGERYKAFKFLSATLWHFFSEFKLVGVKTYKTYNS